LESYPTAWIMLESTVVSLMILTLFQPLLFARGFLEKMWGFSQ
jgi:hypothetical protein